MTDTPTAAPAASPADAPPPTGPAPRPSVTQRWGQRGTVIVLCLGALVFLAIGATLGVALSPSSSSPATTESNMSPGPVDVGFSRDMVVHHMQGVSMATMAQANTQDREVRVVAFDIASTQQTDIGEMQGWLDLWGQSRINPDVPMTWMTGSGGMNMGAAPTTAASAAADGAVMPGMATNTEMAKLKSLRGKESDIYFMQLMVRHHQGGGAMMEYASTHAASPVVRNFAGKMLQAQTQEISIMTQMLQLRGAAPLAFTAPVMPTG